MKSTGTDISCSRVARVGGAAAAGLVGILSLAGAPAALAAEDYLQFSLDGETFTSAVAGPVFDESVIYVPGATSSATLWIRNNSGEPAFLSSAAVVVRSDPQLDNYLGLRAGPVSTLSPRTSLGGAGTCAELNEAWDLGAGEDLELTFLADLSMDAPNETRNRSADFDLVFLLESKAAQTQPRSACAVVGEGQSSLPGGSVPTISLGSSKSERDTGSATIVPANRPLAASPETPVRIANGPVEVRPDGSGADATPVAESAGLAPAGFQSTVEPIIRSLSGTLLIAMSVVFAAAVVLRLRNRSA